MRYLTLFIGISLILASCRKDIKPINSDATPYSFDYPEIMEEYLPAINVPNDNPMTEEGVELGRYLFFDERLSGDNTQSCASCHIPSASFSDTTQFSTGIDGVEGSRNAMPLINLGWMNNGLFWDGRSATAEFQAFEPVVNPIEMHDNWANAISELQGDPILIELCQAAFGTTELDSVIVAKAIAQFERTLIAGNSPFDKYWLTGSTGWNASDELLAYQGYAIYMDENKGDCFHCHGDPFSPLWTDNLYHNNGLDASFTDLGLGGYTNNPDDYGKFKTPTLRNLVFTAPYMHDGRFATLDEVINHYSEGLVMSPTIDPLMKSAPQGGVQLTPQEKQMLKMFLISLSDSSFVNNPAFQDPG